MKTKRFDFVIVLTLILIAMLLIIRFQSVAKLTLHDEFGAVIQLPSNYDNRPTRILYWLHGRHGNAYTCPPMRENPNFIIIAPHFNREAMWKDFDLNDLVERVEDKYPASERYLEGYSRGANGAIYHAAKNPGMFAHVNALAGSYFEKQRVYDSLTIIGGLRDDRWKASSQAYADVVGCSVVWVDSTHDPNEFYGTIKDRVDNPAL